MVTVVIIVPNASVHGGAWQSTSTRTGCSFGKDRAAEATASSHFAAGIPVQTTTGVAAGSTAADPEQAAASQAARKTAATRLAVPIENGSHGDHGSASGAERTGSINRR
jgi:hypothetical protein